MEDRCRVSQVVSRIPMTWRRTFLAAAAIHITTERALKMETHYSMSAVSPLDSVLHHDMFGGSSPNGASRS